MIEEKGKALIERWDENLRWFYDKAACICGLKILEHPMLDYTKINLDMSGCGLDGLQLEKLLMKRGIFAELTTGNILMCMTGIGNQRSDYVKLFAALKEVSNACQIRAVTSPERPPLPQNRLKQCEIPKKKERIPLEEGAGRISALSVIPYPPGIPLVCPGEVIDEEILDYVRDLRSKGEKVIGIDDQGRITVGKE